MGYFFIKRLFFPLSIIPFFFFLLQVDAQVSRKARKILLSDTVIATGHIGISIYNPSTQKYLYNYNADKYFMPASNAKLFSCYAGMKYLADSLVGLRYLETDTGISIYPTADPTFLHPDFPHQPVYAFLSSQKNILFHPQFFEDNLGPGWAWDDYLETYMAPRSEFPMYGNLMKVYKAGKAWETIPKNIKIDSSNANMVNGEINDNQVPYHEWKSNDVHFKMGQAGKAPKEVYRLPLTPDLRDVVNFLSDTLNQPVHHLLNGTSNLANPLIGTYKLVHSQPTDSLLKPMMVNSDNFFAEQTLLMVSNEKLGHMNESDVLNDLLGDDFRGIPQQPRWVDGSGLSRYNLFTPQSFVYVLDMMYNEFGIDRLKGLLPTGGEGTLGNQYLDLKNSLYAKTGSMSNNTAISGFVFTDKGKWLIFSILVNNFRGSSSSVKNSITLFLHYIKKKY